MESNVRVPPKVIRHDDEAFQKICNYLGEIGVLDRPNKTVYLELEVDMRRGVVVTEAWERENPRDDSKEE